MFPELPSFESENDLKLDIGFPVWVALLIFVAIFIGLRDQFDKSPPGPSGYLLIGNSFRLRSTNILLEFRKLRAKYGDIFTYHFGTQQAVVINGHSNLKNLFLKQGDFVSDRPPSFIFQKLGKRAGITSSSGYLWRTHRQFVLNTLRTFWCRNQSIEQKILQETKIFLNEVETYGDTPFNIKALLQKSVANVMFSILCGTRFEYHDPKLKKILLMMNENTQLLGIAGVLDLYPFLKYSPGHYFKCRRIMKNLANLSEMIHEMIDKRMLTYDENDIQDYLDVYIREGKKQSGNVINTFTDDQLVMSIWDMVAGGTDTTASALLWAMLYLLKFSDIQEDLWCEIDTVIGTRQPSLSDRDEMPFCNAFLTEVLRCGNITPLSVQHYCKRDIKFKGFVISKDTVLIPNLDSVNFDPKVFKNPRDFNPLRFIDSDGNFSGDGRILPFSVGRRACIGESIARSELFLFITSFLQRFRIVPDISQKMPIPKGVFGCTNTPVDFEFCVQRR